LNLSIPRLRVFAGPNGSGKSTIKSRLIPEWLGIYVNADEIESELSLDGRLDLSQFEIVTTPGEVECFLSTSPLVARSRTASHWRAVGSGLEIEGSSADSYFASAVADFVRRKLLLARRTFTFETVMSSRDKVEFLQQARVSGFRTYLYYVATEDPEINVSRVRNRVRSGGHPVPEDKIRSRYVRSLDNLLDAITNADRAYVFDNSGREAVWVAEITSGTDLEIRAESMPHWFETWVWNRFDDTEPA